MDDSDFSFLFSQPHTASGSKKRGGGKKDTGIHPKGLRRIISTAKLYDLIDWHWERGAVYHILTGGEIDYLSVLEMALKQQPTREVFITAFTIGVWDVRTLKKWKREKRFDDLFIYLNGKLEDDAAFEDQVNLADLAAESARIKNHSKLIGVRGDRFDAVAVSSANPNKNLRIENISIIVGGDMCSHLKESIRKSATHMKWKLET